jgi:hypothetical protein
MNFIYENNTSLCEELCNEIIELYDKDSEAQTFSGVVKKTNEFIIPKNDEKWNKIEICLYKELHKNILKYIEKINDRDRDINIFKNVNLEACNFIVQKYETNNDDCIFHNDFHYEKEKYRVMTILWYLNDVEDGETQFLDSYKINPKMGKLIMFPSYWTHQYRDLTPKSSKYIIKNWLHLKTF